MQQEQLKIFVPPPPPPSEVQFDNRGEKKHRFSRLQDLFIEASGIITARKPAWSASPPGPNASPSQQSHCVEEEKQG